MREWDGEEEEEQCVLECKSVRSEGHEGSLADSALKEGEEALEEVEEDDFEEVDCESPLVFEELLVCAWPIIISIRVEKFTTTKPKDKSSSSSSSSSTTETTKT